MEYASHGVRVNALCPGWVDTDMGRAGIARIARHDRISEDDAFALAGKMAALGQVLTPAEIAGLAVYVASDEARNLTGQALVLDGGQVMP